MDDASGEGEQESWFGEKGCHESSEMKSGSWRDCCQSGINQANPVKMMMIAVGVSTNTELNI